jgi:tetratricopeptide (TPR) repeat protein
LLVAGLPVAIILSWIFDFTTHGLEKTESAWFLISNDKNTNEGLELIDKALKQRPDDYNYLDTKGWGLYKQGRNTEALEFLEKSDSITKPRYRYINKNHIEEVKKGIAAQQ